MADDPVKAVTCETLANIDRQAQERFSLPGLTLMEIAGYESFLFLKGYLDRLPRSRPTVLFFIGSGNNGGDGLVMARHLFNESVHHSSKVWHNLIIITDTKKKSRSELNRQQLQIVQSLEIPVWDYRKIQGKSRGWQKQIQNPEGVILIDALLGIGAVSRPAQGSASEMISLIHNLTSNFASNPSTTISLDIPSGIHYPLSGNATSTEVYSPVQADITLSYGLLKDLFYYPSIRPLVGEIHLLQPGFPPTLLESAPPRFQMVDRELVAKIITPYRKTDYKKTRGRVAAVAGKRGMLGAATLTTEAAWKSGGGLITLFAPPADRAFLTRSLPHTMVYGHSDFKKYSKCPLQNDFDTVIVGPGLGREGDHLTEILEIILEQNLPTVIDADGIYHYKKILDRSPARRSKAMEKTPVILTPHLGELRHLLNGLEAPDPGVDPFTATEVFFKHYRLKRAVVVLKTNLNYIIPSWTESSYIVEGDNPLLGIGGSGDVLAGMIAALTARRLFLNSNDSSTKKMGKAGKGVDLALIEGAVSGSYLHQEAGGKGRERFGIFTSKQLLKCIPETLAPFLGI